MRPPDALPPVLPPWGVLAEFDAPEHLVDAVRKARAAGYLHVDAYSPFPVDGLAPALGFTRSRVPLLTLVGALGGGVFAYWLQWFSATRSYPIDVGGRPLHSWPMFVPVTFELAVLCASLAAVAAFIFASRLPALHHPLDAVPGFERATRDRFFIVLRAGGSGFDSAEARRWLESLAPLAVHEVEAT